MSTEQWAGVERRAHPRAEVAYALEIEVELVVAEEEGPVLKTEGHTINISRGGMLAQTEHPLPVGTDCLVRFRHAQEVVEPEFKFGTVLRSVELEGTCQAAIRFRSPLRVVRGNGDAGS